jgi:hypothetical protein
VLSGFAPLSRGRQAATVLGLIYAVLGTVGFAVSGFDGFAATRGDTLTIFEVNPLQNLIHLSLGWWLVSSGQGSDERARMAAWAAAAVLGLLGLLALYLFDSRPGMNIINSNRAVDIAHVVSAAGTVLWLKLPSKHAPPA